MSGDETADGVRLGQLLASELTAAAGTLAPLQVEDSDPDVDPTPDGALAYTVGDDDGLGTLARVYVQPTRARIEFLTGVEAAAQAGREAGLRVRPKAVRPPQTLVFVEDGAEVKRVIPVFAAAVDASPVEPGE